MLAPGYFSSIPISSKQVNSFVTKMQARLDGTIAYVAANSVITLPGGNIIPNYPDYYQNEGADDKFFSAFTPPSVVGSGNEAFTTPDEGDSGFIDLLLIKALKTRSSSDITALKDALDNYQDHYLNFDAGTSSYHSPSWLWSQAGRIYIYSFTSATTNTSTDTITVTPKWGAPDINTILTPGSGAKVNFFSGATASGLTEATLYFAASGASNEVTLHTSRAGAIAGTGKVDITAISGSFELYVQIGAFRATQVASNVITFDAIPANATTSSTYEVHIASSTASWAGLTTTNQRVTSKYWIRITNVGSKTATLHSSLANAIAGTPVVSLTDNTNVAWFYNPGPCHNYGLGSPDGTRDMAYAFLTYAENFAIDSTEEYNYYKIGRDLGYWLFSQLGRKTTDGKYVFSAGIGFETSTTIQEIYHYMCAMNKWMKIAQTCSDKLNGRKNRYRITGVGTNQFTLESCPFWATTTPVKLVIEQGATGPTGPSEGTQYYINRPVFNRQSSSGDAAKVSLSSSRANALTDVLVSITSGSGTGKFYLEDDGFDAVECVKSMKGRLRQAMEWYKANFTNIDAYLLPDGLNVTLATGAVSAPTQDRYKEFNVGAHRAFHQLLASAVDLPDQRNDILDILRNMTDHFITYYKTRGTDMFFAISETGVYEFDTSIATYSSGNAYRRTGWVCEFILALAYLIREGPYKAEIIYDKHFDKIWNSGSSVFNIGSNFFNHTFRIARPINALIKALKEFEV